MHHKDPVELVPLAEECKQCLGSLMKAVIAPQVARLEELQRYGRMILTKMKLPKGAIPVILEGKSPNVRFYHFSFDELGLCHPVLHRRRGCAGDRGVLVQQQLLVQRGAEPVRRPKSCASRVDPAFAELETLRDIAAAWLAADAKALAQAIEQGLLQEVKYGREET